MSRTPAFDLASIDPSNFIEFRDKWLIDSGLEDVGADRLFDNVGLSELIELSTSELKEYGKEIGLSVIQRKRLIKGICKLNPSESAPPPSSHRRANTTTASPSKKLKLKRSKSSKPKKNNRPSLKKQSKSSHTRSRSHARSKSKSKSRTRSKPSTPQIDELSELSSIDLTKFQAPKSTETSSDKSFDVIIEDALRKLNRDATSTKDEIRKTFMNFKLKLSQREMKLLHDVDATVDKKSRLLQTQLDYVKDNKNLSFSSSELACDPLMSLQIEKAQILRTLVTSGYIEGASSDNKEEQEMQERERKRRELSRQQFVCVERLKQITIFERDCNAKREDSVRLGMEVQEEIEKINYRTMQCEAELAVAKPLLLAAQKLVSKISKRQLQEIRALKSPSPVVELVMTAVAVMLGHKIKSWRDIQKILANASFVPSILEFDTMNLRKKTREECLQYVEHEDFNEERANKASKVAGPLVKWVKSQMKYSELCDVVRPMQREIKVLKKKLDKKQKQLKLCTDSVDSLEVKISESRAEIDQMVANMIKMQDEYDFSDDPLLDAAKNMDVYANISV